MKTLPLLLLCAVALTGAAQGEDEAVLPREHIEAISEDMVTGDSHATVPEPSSTLFAGLGGLTILFFLSRRKPVR